MRLTHLLLSLLAVPLQAQVMLSECMASNRSGLLDRDGLHADWLELHNAGAVTEPLHGRILEDEAGHRWTFPDVAIAGHDYLVVFMTGKDRRDPGQPLHAGFRIGRGGGSLRLLERDGSTELSRLRFGRQFDDVATGYRQPYEPHTLVGPCDVARYQIPRGGLPADWNLPAFRADKWLRASGGFGFCNSDRPGIREWIGTDLGADMRSKSATACFRYTFDVEDSRGLTSALLRVRCVGGYVAWLNGTEIARLNVPADLGPGTKALTWVDGADGRLLHETDVANFSTLLRERRNVLAVRSFTTSQNAFDHLMMAELEAYRPGAPATDEVVFFTTPTPGRPNGEGNRRIAGRPRFAEASTLSPQVASFSLDEPGKGTVRYTTDGSDPTFSSPVLDRPIAVERSAVLRARRFRTGRAPSPIASVHYTALASDLADYRSDLPMLVISTHGAAVENKEWVDGHISAIALGDSGTCTLSDTPQYCGHGAIRLRGSSTLNLPKRSYAIELRTDEGRGLEVPLFGMPSSDDWVLYAPHNYDQSHLRNALCYELARRIGLASPRWQFVELFVDTDGGKVSRDDYKGLYLLVERISIGMERVQVEPVGPLDTAEPEITGGYILKIDRPGPGDEGFDSGGQRLQFVAPKERHITDPQRAWLQSWFDRFGSMLSGPDLADPERGYAAFIDVDAFIDFHFFHEYAKNPDAYTLSTYMNKPRGGKLRMGPIWDFDRAMRTNDAEYWVGRGARPEGWTADNYYGWWGALFRDPAFRSRYRQRGRAWLEGELSTARVHALIREIAAGIAAAEERDRQRWPIIAAGKWHDELADLERWITDRTQWFREELLEKPEFISSKDGVFSIPFTLSMRHDNDAGTLYYTLDGADPRLESGQRSPSAMPYEQPIAIDADRQVRARVLVGDLWSRETFGSYVRQLPTLVVSELMFNPKDGHRAEFVELWNYGEQAIDMSGIHIDGPIHYHFGTGPVRALGPGQRVVIVNHETTFRDRYDCVGILVAGEFLGVLSNTQDALTITGPVGELVQSVKYLDTWHPGADGTDFSLELRTPKRIAESKEDWQVGTVVRGTPGR
ncbi:MAG: CotH kinase family protein [Planctomycetes bacterium]|nr:CotH kinase family protein [Planctomycetota bacterium]